MIVLEREKILGSMVVIVTECSTEISFDTDAV